MEFGHIKEYNMNNIFLEKPYTNYGGETSSRPFSEKLKLSISLDQQFEFLLSSFYTSGLLLQGIKTKLLITCFYIL